MARHNIYLKEDDYRNLAVVVAAMKALGMIAQNAGDTENLTETVRYALQAAASVNKLEQRIKELEETLYYEAHYAQQREEELNQEIERMRWR